MRSMTRYQANRHPVGTFLTLLILGPYVLAAALVVLVVYIVFAVFLLAFGRKELA